MRVQLIGEVSGTRNGQQWPPRFTVVDLPDDEAIRLVDQRMARPYVEVDEGRAVVLPVEDQRGSVDGQDATVAPPGVEATVAADEAPAVRRRRA